MKWLADLWKRLNPPPRKCRECGGNLNRLDLYSHLSCEFRKYERDRVEIQKAIDADPSREPRRLIPKSTP